MESDGFPNRQQRFSYLIALEHAKRVRLDPSLLTEASRHMDRRSPECRAGEDLWRRTIAEGVEAVVAALTDRSPSGDYARETAPAFGGIPAPRRRELLAAAYLPFDTAGPAG